APPVSNDRNRMARKPAVSAQHLLCVLRRKFQVVVRIENTFQHLGDLVRRAVILWQNVVKTLGRFSRRAAMWPRPLLRDRSELLTNQTEAVRIVLGHVMSHTADTRVHARAAQRFGIDHLAHSAFHKVWTA